MAALQDIVRAVAESTCDGSAGLEFRKGAHATGEGDRYEERVLALVFLRCLRRRLLFQLSANNGDAGKFDDVALVWRPGGQPGARTLLVQLKHKTSPRAMTVAGGTWLSEAPNSDFGLSKYCASYSDIGGKQEIGPVTCVLVTNARLGQSSLDLFERRDAASVPGLELVLAGGDLYQLNPNSRQVGKAVRGNASFVEHFYLLCEQRNSVEIARDICGELEHLLGAGDLCGTICDSLCKGIREWMNNQSVCLTSGWSEWQQLVDEFVGKEVSESRAVTTGLRYRSVGDVRAHVESHNPAWVRPPGRGTAALSATKLHQALIRETHVMVAVERYAERRDRILRCWGPFCRWLVIVDDDREGNRVILDELLSQTQSERRLVIVSSREGDCFSDEYNSSDVSDDSWNELLDVEVRLNGDGWRCCLRDLVGGAGAAESLRSLLASEPALLLALARLSQPLRMGQGLETLPAHYVHRELVGRRLLTDEFFSSLGGIAKFEKGQLGASDTVSSVVIVEGRPGVGKSKMLSHVAKEIKGRVPECWLLRVNLSEFYEVLRKSDSGASAMRGILQRAVFNKEELGRLEYALLRHSLEKSPRVVCLVDGFDEVCPDYVDRCLEALGLLAPRRGKLFVTTRPAALNLLKSQTGASTLSLEPFSPSELDNFFRLHPSGANITPVSALNCYTRDLLRLPLFAEMFASLPQKGQTYDIVTLYEAFFQNKFRRLHEEKWGDNLSAPGKMREVEEAQKRHEGQLMLLAVSSMLRRTDAKAKLSLDTEYFVRTGIVYQFADGEPEFLHRTFAEHFLAQWCFSRDGVGSRADVYREAYLERRLVFFRECFDRRAVRGRPPLEALLGALLDNGEGGALELVARGFDPLQRDACGRSALHLAAAHGAQRLLSALLRCRGLSEGALSARDGLLGWTPARYAAEGGHSLAVRELLSAGGRAGDLGDLVAAQHDPGLLQLVFHTGGYLALYRHVVENDQLRRGQIPSSSLVGLKQCSVLLKHADNPRRMPNLVKDVFKTRHIAFAASLMAANVPRDTLDLIAEEALKANHIAVWNLLSRSSSRKVEEEMDPRENDTNNLAGHLRKLHIGGKLQIASGEAIDPEESSGSCSLS